MCLCMFIGCILEGVLIDTWWNVNNSIRERYTGGNSVLIDTWWNVNE